MQQGQGFMEALLDDQTDLFTLSEGDMDTFNMLFPENTAQQALQTALNDEPLMWPPLLASAEPFAILDPLPANNNAASLAKSLVEGVVQPGPIPMQTVPNHSSHFVGGRESTAAHSAPDWTMRDVGRPHPELREQSPPHQGNMREASSNDSSGRGIHIPETHNSSFAADLQSRDPHPASTSMCWEQQGNTLHARNSNAAVLDRFYTDSVVSLPHTESGSLKNSRAGSEIDLRHDSSKVRRVTLDQPLKPSSQKSNGKLKKPASAASLAQKKYMERKKMKDMETEKQVAELTRALEKLMREKKDLEEKERVNNDALKGVLPHMDRLFAHKVVREFQQLSLLKSKAELHSMLEGKHVDVDGLKNWTVKEYIEDRFQVYFEEIKRLLPEARLDNSCAASERVQKLVASHTEFGRPAAIVSCFHWALLCYNLQEARALIDQGHSQPDTRSVLQSLSLSSTQKQNLLKAREILLRSLHEICTQRQGIFSQLGLESAVVPPAQMHRCPSAMDLYNNLKKEQTAVLGFIMDVDINLNPLQYALLDAHCAPWCPDLVALLDLLDAETPATGKRLVSAITTRLPADIPVMPRFTPYEVLTMPLTGYGCGKDLRFGAVMCPSWTVLSSLCCPIPDRETLSSMSLLGAMVGCWRKYTSWQWLVQVKERGLLFENPMFRDEAEARLHHANEGDEACGMSVQ